MGNYITPYSGIIPGGVRENTEVMITGAPWLICTSFSINLCTGNDLEDDCGLHFSPSCGDKKVLRNHKKNGEWGKQEISYGSQFQGGKRFQIHLKVHNTGYSILVNGQNFCEFDHHISIDKITHIYIDGRVTIDEICFSRSSKISGCLTGPEACPGKGNSPNDLPIPFTTVIPGGMTPGRTIYISGIPHPNPSSFIVNLQCGPHESDDVTLYIEARFNRPGDRDQVITNYKQNGCNGEEDKHLTFFPFTPNKPFVIMIISEPSGFKIEFDKKDFVNIHRHKMPFTQTNHINVTGDVTINEVQFQ